MYGSLLNNKLNNDNKFFNKINEKFAKLTQFTVLLGSMLLGFVIFNSHTFVSLINLFLFNGTKKLYIHAEYVKEIIAAINLCNKYKLQFVLVGGSDAGLVLNLLKENNISVILGRTHTLPNRDDDAIDAPYALPKKLKDAGILFALSCDGFWQVRNLPFMAGTAAAYGLNKEEALSAITNDAAKITGMDQQVGSISVGKDATILICEGDLLDMKSSVIKQAFIQGRMIDIDNIQHQLYEKYKKKYNLK